MPADNGRAQGAGLVPVAYRLGYRLQDGAVRRFEVDGFVPYVTQDLSVYASFDGEVLAFEVTPLVPLQVTGFEVEFAHGFQQDERVLLNGYQSWSTTKWVPAFARMHGLNRVPRFVADRFALDALGDYRFARYTGKPGRQHGYSYCAFFAGGVFSLVGSLDERSGFTRISIDAPAGKVLVRRECPQRLLEPDAPVVLARLALLSGGEDAVYDRWFQLMGVHARPVRPLVGYSSWYRHYGDISQQKLESDLSGASRALAGVHADGATLLFQVDDGFAKVGDWLDVKTQAFPQGMGALATRIRQAGFLPGLWLAPFVCEKESRLYAEHPDWLLRDEKGEEVRTGSHWSGGYALDTLNPQVRDYVRTVLQTVTREWGFGLLKLDFLYAACLVPHGGMTRGQLMADAMGLLREAVGDKVLLLGCGVPLASAFGVVDYCRIGCDVGLDWDDVPPMRLLHRERVSTKNSLGNTIARAPLDGRAFGNDPDVLFLRDDVRLTLRQRMRLLRADAGRGSMLLTSDDMGQWDDGKRRLFQEAVDTLLARKAR